MADWRAKFSTLGYATESTFGVPASEPDYLLKCEVPKTPELARDQERPVLLEGRISAKSAPMVGRKHGSKVTIRFPITGMKTGYTPSSALSSYVPVWFRLLCIALGSGASNAWATQARVADGVDSGSTSTVVKTASGTMTVGTLLVTALNGGSAPSQIGWQKSKTGTPSEVSLVEESKDENGTELIASTGDEILQSATAFASSTEQTPLTFFHYGEKAGHTVRFCGAVCEKVRLQTMAGKAMFIEFDYIATDYDMVTRGADGLDVPDTELPMPPLVGRNHARFTLHGVEDEPTTGTPVGDIGDFAIEIACNLSPFESYSGRQGVSRVTTVDRDITISLTAPWKDDDMQSDGSHMFQLAYENQKRLRLGLYVGVKAGQILSIIIPAAIITEQPKLADKNGVVCWGLKLEPSAYLEDATAGSGDTPPADTVFRLGIA